MLDTAESRHVVITVHGIRTFGQWQERLTRLLQSKSDKIEVLNYKFGRFSLIAFFIPFLRWITTRRFRKELLEIARDHPDSRIDLVGHSFGTHLIGWGLLRTPEVERPDIHTIILAGSVLRPGFSWNDLLNRGAVQRVINECGTKDLVLVVNQIFVLLTGIAGILGFKGMTGDRLRNNWYALGHSGYFIRNGRDSDEFMGQRWVPLLTGEDTLPQVDERSPGWSYNLWVFLLQNLELIKVVAYGICLFAAISWYHTTRQARLIAVARGLATQSEMIEKEQPSLLPRSALIAVDSLRATPTIEGDMALRGSLSLMPQYLKEFGNFPAGVSISAMAVSSDGALLALAGSNNSVQVWQTLSATKIADLPHQFAIEALAFSSSNNELFVLTKDGALWRRRNGVEQLLGRTIGNDADTAAIFQAHAGPIVAAANSDFTVTVAEPTSVRKTVLRHGNRVLALSFNNDGTQLATGAYDYSARVWSIRGDRPTVELVKHNHPVSAIALDPSGRFLALGDTFGSIRIRDLLSGQDIGSGIRHLDWITALKFSPDGQWLASASRDLTVRIWDAESGDEVARITDEKSFSSVAFSADSRVLITGGDSGSARMWDLSKTLPKKTNGQACALVFSGDGHTLVLGDSYGNVEIDTSYPRAQWTKLREVIGQESAVLATAYDPRGPSVVAGFDDGTLRTWKIGAQVEPGAVIHTGVPANSMALSADGRFAASGDWNGQITVFSTATGQALASMIHPGGVLDISVTGDGKYIATGGSDKTARVWDWTNNQPTAQITLDGDVEAIAFSRDGRYLAVASGSMIEVWDSSNPRSLRKLAVLLSDATVEFAAFSPDDRLLLTTGNHSARLWKWASSERVAELQLDGGLCAAAFTHDNRIMALGSADGSARSWPLTADGLIDEACSRLSNYPLNNDNRRAYIESCKVH